MRNPLKLNEPERGAQLVNFSKNRTQRRQHIITIMEETEDHCLIPFDHYIFFLSSIVSSWSNGIDLVQSRSTNQPKMASDLMKTLRKKLGEVVSKLIIYERLPMNLAISPWLHNLINATAAEIGTRVKFPTPYKISDVYLESEFQSMKECIDRMKMIWQEKEVGEQYVVQVITDNEGALKASSKKLMEKRKHIFWTPCAAHCIDLCLEDIGKIIQ
ncbi:hypothetical protein G2W53_009596 [Senna tora]|uniref:DUF659 domain-containing protein n=1 Tax=Senna tora TaxID=362788 RepID=A0A835CCW2_9FABA|nr:hypothetical protein G2W53_009596 [Senna tora]